MYTKTYDAEGVENPNVIQRLTDGAFIPRDPHNSDYQAFLAWQADGNTLLEGDINDQD